LNKELAKVSLKVICSFLNTDGGSLLIGVKDDGEVTGMDTEISQFHKNSFDGFKIWFGRLLDMKFKNFLHLIDFELIKVHDNKHVLEVRCAFIKEGRGCYLDGEFYIRRNPYTERLEGEELVDYCSKKGLI
jgi:predicted HTH transcriptional regulator